MSMMTIYIDEVGRWPLAGPVYVWLVLIKNNVSLEIYKDSKKCSPTTREILYQKIINENYIHRATAKCEHDFIDTYWINKAIYTSICLGLEKLLVQQINKKIKGLKDIIKYIGKDNIKLIIDGNYDFNLKKILDIEVETIIHGDDLIKEISVASILAKVQRDREMIAYHQKYPQYAFNKNKGYGTLIHRQALKDYGPCNIHRKTYITKLIV